MLGLSNIFFYLSKWKYCDGTKIKPSLCVPNIIVGGGQSNLIFGGQGTDGQIYGGLDGWGVERFIRIKYDIAKETCDR